MTKTKDVRQPKDQGSVSSHCYDAIKVYTDGREEPLLDALANITDEWVDAGQACSQTTLDLRDACRSLVMIADLWDWMIEMRSRIDKDSNVNRRDIWVFLDVDDEIVCRGVTPIDAIERARFIVDGTPQKCQVCGDNIKGHEDDSDTLCRWCVTGWKPSSGEIETTSS